MQIWRVTLSCVGTPDTDPASVILHQIAGCGDRSAFPTLETAHRTGSCVSTAAILCVAYDALSRHVPIGRDWRILGGTHTASKTWPERTYCVQPV
jgi:hypothetical protein